jgi:hypothetical protein
MSPVQPNNVAMLKMTIQAIAAGWTCIRANSVAPPNMSPIPPVTVNPKTMAGKLNFIGLTTGAG